MTLRKALLAATVLALPVAAQAQPVSGLYIGAAGGLNIHQDSRFDGAGSNTRLEYKDLGAVGLASIGWGFGNGLRAEVEGNYRENEVERARVAGFRSTSAGGYLRNYGVMANVLYDINIPSFPVTPYVGVGAGYGWIESKKVRASAAGLTVTSEDTDSRFAYQAIAGAAFNLPVPGLALTAEYRFYGTLDPELRGSVRTGGANGPVIATDKTELTNYNHSVLVGVRYAFNTPVAPPPVVTAPPVAPAPTVARTYLVFFDWDRADLTDRARQIISEAAGAARSVQSTRIEVAGHADRSGTPQYNQRLSQRRADAVAAELVRQGVNRNEIMVTAFGESRPLVPTADGVREPQNRRVEIVLR
jgi:outer membrane protein OmpA-like peptidoglycan-associated protein/outer membrane protein W